MTDEMLTTFPLPLRHHVGQHQLQGVEHALQIDVLHFVPLRFGHSEKRLARIDAGVVDQHIDAAEIADGAFHPRCDVAGEPHVAAEGRRGTARRDDGFGNPPATFEVAIEK